MLSRLTGRLVVVRGPTPLDDVSRQEMPYPAGGVVLADAIPDNEAVDDEMLRCSRHRVEASRGMFQLNLIRMSPTTQAA